MAYNSPDAGYLALLVGVDNNIFQKFGLDVNPVLLATSTTSMSALLSGQVQFIQSGAAAAVGPAADGVDLSVVAIWIPVYNYVLDASPGIQSAADLKGKTLAGDAIGGSADLALIKGVQALGLDPTKDVSILELGATNLRAAALESGQVQATVETPPDNLELERQGYNKIVDLASLHQPAAGQSTITRKGWVDANRDVAQRYIEAMMYANLVVKRDPETALATMRSRMQGHTEEDLEATYLFYVQEVFPDVPLPSPADLTDAIQALSQTNAKLKDFDASTVIDPSLVQYAQSQGIG